MISVRLSSHRSLLLVTQIWHDVYYKHRSKPFICYSLFNLKRVIQYRQKICTRCTSGYFTSKLFQICTTQTHCDLHSNLSNSDWLPATSGTTSFWQNLLQVRATDLSHMASY